MQEVIILRGLPGSGKTTWAKEYCIAHPEYRRVSKDDIRAMLGAEFSKENEDAVCDIRDRIIQVLIGHLFSIIVDDTNMSRHHVTRIDKLATNWDTRCRVMDFKTPIDECIARDAMRPNPVGADVIRRMAEL
jgi:predicted kinase